MGSKWCGWWEGKVGGLVLGAASVVGRYVRCVRGFGKERKVTVLVRGGDISVDYRGGSGFRRGGRILGFKHRVIDDLARHVWRDIPQGSLHSLGVSLVFRRDGRWSVPSRRICVA